MDWRSGLGWGRFPVLWEAAFQPSGALRREPCQTLAVKVEVDEGEVRAQSMVVFRDASIPHLVEAEDPLQDAEDMFHFRSYP